MRSELIAHIVAQMENEADEGFSFERAAEAALSALASAGMMVVPVEPTMKMREEGLFANNNALLMSADCNDMANAYRAMLAASPLQNGEVG